MVNPQYISSIMLAELNVEPAKKRKINIRLSKSHWQHPKDTADLIQNE